MLNVVKKMPVIKILNMKSLNREYEVDAECNVCSDEKSSAPIEPYVM